MELVHLADRLAPILERYPPKSKECVACAHEVWQLLRSAGLAAEVIRVTHALLGRYFHTQDGVCFAETGFHVTVRVSNLLIDALTGPEGKLQHEYYTLWRDIESHELIFTPMETTNAPSA
jgi:hypothetical protein